MKPILLLLFLSSAMMASSQSFNNEWIDYSKTYYKFQPGATGVYRISLATLTAAGINGTPAEQFQLWRNGVEIPIYTTSATGPLGAGGYIEFWGEQNDGKVDKVLYNDMDYQLSDKFSLQTDTVSF